MSRGEVKTAACWRGRVANHVLPVGAFYFLRRSAATIQYPPSRRKNVRQVLRRSKPIRRTIKSICFCCKVCWQKIRSVFPVIRTSLLRFIILARDPLHPPLYPLLYVTISSPLETHLLLILMGVALSTEGVVTTLATNFFLVPIMAVTTDPPVPRGPLSTDKTWCVWPASAVEFTSV